MTGILKNLIVFVISESFLGAALLPLLADCVRSWGIFTGCAASKQIPFFAFAYYSVSSVCAWRRQWELRLLKMSSFIIFLIQLNNGSLVMSFLAQMLSILIKEKNYSWEFNVLFHCSGCLKIKWLVTLSAHITKCRRVFSVLKMISPTLIMFKLSAFLLKALPFFYGDLVLHHSIFKVIQ